MAIMTSRAAKTGCIAVISAAEPALMPNLNALGTTISQRQCPKNPISELRWSCQCRPDRKLV
tara:strand:- start:311 stop:496 length:186 start_codon:yes stop_codon:yes gene_type:complete